MVLGTTGAGRRLKVVVLNADPEYVVTVADRDEGAVVLAAWSALIGRFPELKEVVPEPRKDRY